MKTGDAFQIQAELELYRQRLEDTRSRIHRCETPEEFRGVLVMLAERIHETQQLARRAIR